MVRTSVTHSAERYLCSITQQSLQTYVITFVKKTSSTDTALTRERQSSNDQNTPFSPYLLVLINTALLFILEKTFLLNIPTKNDFLASLRTSLPYEL